MVAPSWNLCIKFQMFQLYCCLHKCALSSTVIFESSKQNIYKFFTAALIWMQIPVYFILYVYSLPNIRSPNLSDIFWQLFFFRIIPIFFPDNLLYSNPPCLNLKSFFYFEMVSQHVRFFCGFMDSFSKTFRQKKTAAYVSVMTAVSLLDFFYYFTNAFTFL